MDGIFNSGFDTIVTPSNTRVYSFDSFTLETNTEARNVRDIESILGAFSEPISLESLQVSSLQQALQLIGTDGNFRINFDKQNLTSYAFYGSLRNRFTIAIQNILSNFPGSLFIQNRVNGATKLNVLNYNYNSDSNLSTFDIPASCVQNLYFLDYDQTALTIGENNTKNVAMNFNLYEIFRPDTNTTFEILNYTPPPTRTTGSISIICRGNVFPEIISPSTTLSIAYHIKPIDSVLGAFIQSLDSLEQHFFDRDGDGNYVFRYKEPRETETGRINFLTLSLIWPRTDGYNLDLNTTEYSTFLNDLLVKVADVYDRERTNIIARKFVADGVREFGDESGKFEALLAIYGYNFDQIKNAIDSIAYGYTVSYDKVNNIQDRLIKDLARTLGLTPLNINTGLDLVTSFGRQNDLSDSQIPVELDLELWRRIVINLAFLFRRKGTAKAINFLIRLIGLPDALIEINEFVYVAENKLDSDTLNTLFSGASISSQIASDVEGYPRTLQHNSDYYFQSRGGWYQNIEVLRDVTDPQQIHTGNYDRGQSYFKPFEDAGFTLNRFVDNKKSWVRYESASTRIDVDRNINYSIDDERLVLNNKEIEVSIDPARAIENAVYTFNKVTDYPVSSTGYTGRSYPNNLNTVINVSDYSFAEYLDLVSSEFILARNRKVIFDTNGGSYPTLRQLYRDYLVAASPNGLDYESTRGFVESLEEYWIELLVQFIPSTTIFLGSSVTYRNTIFDVQKFRYKRGINDGSEFQSTQELETSLVEVKPIQITSLFTKNSEGVLSSFEFGNQEQALGACIVNNNVSVNGKAISITGWTQMQITNNPQFC